jgi:hypothetical protein
MISTPSSSPLYTFGEGCSHNGVPLSSLSSEGNPVGKSYPLCSVRLSEGVDLVGIGMNLTHRETKMLPWSPWNFERRIF